LDRKELSLSYLLFTPRMFFTHTQLRNFLIRTRSRSLETLKEIGLQYIASILSKLCNLQRETKNRFSRNFPLYCQQIIWTGKIV